MNFDALVQSVIDDTLSPGGSLAAFRPELTICATIVAMLVVKMAVPRWRNSAFFVALLGLFVAMYLALPRQWFVDVPQGIFTATLINDSFTIILRVLLLLFSTLFVMFTQVVGNSDGDEMTEFYTLILGALLGMCLMISANHILIVLLGMEMASVPCYVLAGMQRHRAKSSEAALKYAVFGAGTAGIMLYGMSLLVGVLGSAQLPAMTTQLLNMIQQGVSTQQATVLILGGLMLMVGVAFKLSAVPFHFWAPDVFEGATAEVAAFLSVASKAAALGLLVRLALGFSYPVNVGFPTELVPHIKPDDAVVALQPVQQFISAMIALMAAVTCTFGNLAAYGQNNMKRLLAYSTIAHAGYMMMPVAAAVALVGVDGNAPARDAIGALVVYIAIYLFMNLAAFAIVAVLRNVLGSEEIPDYAGLVRRSPGLTVCMAIVLFSLVGLPPLAGFSAKLAIFSALVQAKLWWLFLLAGLNTVLSLFYYLRVVRVMVLSPEPLYRDTAEVPLTSAVGLYCTVLTAPVVLLFFMFGPLLKWANEAAHSLFFR